MIDVAETQDSQREHGRVAVEDGKRTDGEHPAWCSPEHCWITDEGIRVHEQTPTRWQDDATAGQFHGIVPVDVARRLRDQLTEHLDAVR